MQNLMQPFGCGDVPLWVLLACIVLIVAIAGFFGFIIGDIYRMVKTDAELKRQARIMDELRALHAAEIYTLTHPQRG